MRTWSLVGISAAYGCLASFVFSRMANLGAIRARRRRMHAQLLALRLFADEPLLVLRTQLAFIVENIRVILMLLPAVAVLTIPMLWLFPQLEVAYGLAPLTVGQSAIVTAQMAGPLMPDDANSTVTGPAGIAIETPPVRVVHENQISWRIQPRSGAAGRLHFNIRGAGFDKTIAAGAASSFVSPSRVRPLWQFVASPQESRLPPGSVSSIQIDYPKANVSLFGISMPWFAWFLLISTVSALAFARWRGIKM